MKNIYESNFSNVSVNLIENILQINVNEFPIIENISYKGIKADKIKNVIFKDLKLKPRSSYNEIFLNEDKKKIQDSLRILGYFFSSVNISITQLDDNKVDLEYNIDL